MVEVAEAAHGGGDETLAGDGEKGDADDGEPLADEIVSRGFQGGCTARRKLESC